MDKATDIGTLLEVRDYIHSNYYFSEDNINIRFVLKNIMADITDVIDTLMDEMYTERVGLND
jgi:hypothetical protein